MPAPEPRPGVLDITPYKGGASKAAGAARVYKLSSNESALGASPAALEAIRANAEAPERYPDGSATELRAALAALHGLEADRIVCGAGSDEVLQLLCRAYLGPCDAIVQSEHGFLVYAIAATGCGARVVKAPERDLTTDIDAVLAAVDSDTKIVFVANPNNPTGTWIPRADLLRLRDGLPDGVILVVDAAYAEYMDDPDYEDGFDLARNRDDVVVTRTFSKIYGLGGLRLGWGYCPPAVADVLNRIRGPFNVASTALAAGLAALGDQAFVERNRAHNAAERARLVAALEARQFVVTPSAGNFVLVRVPGDGRARALHDRLAAGGVLVRDVAAYGLPEHLRVSIGSTEANDAFLAALDGSAP
ncbi:MAG: histidinol-phosphate transaminase [Pseudomonadota bacterium]